MSSPTSILPAAEVQASLLCGFAPVRPTVRLHPDSVAAYLPEEEDETLPVGRVDAVEVER